MKKTIKKPKKWDLNRTAHQYALFGVALLLAVASGLGVLYALRMQRQDAQAARQARESSTLSVVKTRKTAARELMSGRPIKGKSGLVVTVTVRNTTGKPQGFIPVHQTFIRDGMGNTYDLKPLDTVRQPIAGGHLQPGDSRTGELSYIIPDNATNLRYFFDSRWDNAAPVTIDL